MRLIDADKIIKHMDETVDVISRKDIDNAPTIKAIPVEWLRNYVSIWISELYKNFVLNMINVWEKENGKDSE